MGRFLDVYTLEKRYEEDLQPVAELLEAQLERVTPGFEDLVLARRTMNTADLERYSPNYMEGTFALLLPQQIGEPSTAPRSFFYYFSRYLPKVKTIWAATLEVLGDSKE